MKNTILIIDDSPEGVAVIERALGHAGVKNSFLVTGAEDGLKVFDGDGPYPCIESRPDSAA